jgi:DNA modification methylase
MRNVVVIPADWPADNVERRPIETLLPYARNAKKHPAEQVAQIAASIVEFGWTMPVLVDPDGTLIVGHGRVLAAQQLGIPQIPTMVARNWTEAQIKAYRLVDNRLAESPWDKDLLAGEMMELADLGFDLDLTGFDAREQTSLLTQGTPLGNCDPDDAPGIPKNPITKLGDVWVLESGYGLTHRVVCGDCTDSAYVGAALNGIEPHLMVTDPPYGVKYDADWRNTAKRSDGTPYGASAIGKVSNDARSDWREAYALFPGFVAYVWHSGLFSGVVAESLAVAGFAVRAQIVWVKSQHVISRGHYHPQHEPLLYAQRGDNDHWVERFEEDHAIGSYAARKGHAADWQGSRKESTVWEIPKPQNSETGHSTQKPVECMARPMRNNSTPGQAVYEPFLGSGTTVIAGEMLGRPIHAVEINPAYVDVAVARWCKFSGKKAVREGDGFVWDGVYEEVKHEENN